VPSEREVKLSQMNNAVYNEYTIEELEAAFRFVSWKLLVLNCNRDLAH
jgi:hypothetical protein